MDVSPDSGLMAGVEEVVPLTHRSSQDGLAFSVSDCRIC